MNLKNCVLIACFFLASIGTVESFAQIKNPILPGFYPDPSICRVDDDYFLVNSSFSFYPGVPIFHSRDLIHWEQIGHILNRPSQLNITNQRISAGIYAPTLRYNNGTYYMITTFVEGGGNFFVSAKSPVGPWSDPVWLPKTGGIDPSFFFDKNGKAYIVNNDDAPDNKPLYSGHRTIRLQEFDLETQKVVGEQKIIVDGGTDISKKPVWIEGPHIYQKDDYYFLMAAEGGTAEDHSEVIFRSKNIWGPYESFSGNPILTQRDLAADRPNPVTSAGHADLVETPNGDWVAVFLACQPYSGNLYNTGRQTFFNRVDWSGDWPIILEKGKAVPETVNSPINAQSTGKTFAESSESWLEDFSGQKLKMDWNFIRTPKSNWYRLFMKNLLLNARPVSISENGNPSFIGRRLQHTNAEMTTSVKLEKGKDVEAGLVAFQNEHAYYSFLIQEKSGKYYLKFESANPDSTQNVKPELKELAKYNPEKFVLLKMKITGGQLECMYSMNAVDWISFGGKRNAENLSTAKAGGFVGAYLGLYAYAKDKAVAYFDWVTYHKLAN